MVTWKLKASTFVPAFNVGGSPHAVVERRHRSPLANSSSKKPYSYAETGAGVVLPRPSRRRRRNGADCLRPPCRCHRDWAVGLGALGPQPGLSSFLSGERPVTAGATVDGTRTGAVVESSVELTPSPHGSFLRHYNGPVFPHAARSRRNVSLRTTERRPAKIVLGATFCRTRQEKSGVAAKWLSASSRANKVKNKVKM